MEEPYFDDYDLLFILSNFARSIFRCFFFVPRHEVGELRNAAVRLSFRRSHTCEHDISKTIALTNFSFGILVRYRDM